VTRATQSSSCDRARAQIALELDSEFSQFERARRATHVARCSECRAFAVEVQEFTRMLREAPPELLTRQITVRRPRTAARSFRIPAVAAAMVLALVGLTTQLAAEFASRPSAARGGPTVYPTGSDLQSEIEVIEALTESPRLMADNANLR
jgi:predicted anti-sigma-YlaC factor YlaD